MNVMRLDSSSEARNERHGATSMVKSRTPTWAAISNKLKPMLYLPTAVIKYIFNVVWLTTFQRSYANTRIFDWSLHILLINRIFFSRAFGLFNSINCLAKSVWATLSNAFNPYQLFAQVITKPTMPIAR